MLLTHKIALYPNDDQRNYFKRASGTSRFVWNWALDEWNRQYASGQKPNAMALKKQFNTIKYIEFPWLSEMHRDSHAQPFSNLAKAWNRFFSDIKSGKPANEPRFKKKGRCRDSFYVANDKFSMNKNVIRLPKIGEVRMAEELRFEGKISGATVSRTADRWFVAIQVDVAGEKAKRKRTSNGIEGIDLGLKAAATLSTGETIKSPRPLKAALRRIKILGRSISRKFESAKERLGFAKKAKLPKGTKIVVSNNQKKVTRKLACSHARVVNLRTDFCHKLTTRLCRENQTVVIEDLNVKGMMANEKLARAISDIGFGEIRRQLEYKALRYETKVIVADRWYPSSRFCSSCGWKNEALTLKDREWTCQKCGIHHDRDVNAAINLKRLATINALPVASPTGNGGAAS